MEIIQRGQFLSQLLSEIKFPLELEIRYFFTNETPFSDNDDPGILDQNPGLERHQQRS